MTRQGTFGVHRLTLLGTLLGTLLASGAAAPAWASTTSASAPKASPTATAVGVAPRILTPRALAGRAPRQVAAAALTASCLVTEIHATNDKQGIDPKLARLKAKLSKPPFSAWDTFKQLAEPTVTAEKDKPAQAKLATGGTITLLLKDKVVSQGGKARLRVGIDADDKDGKRTLSTVMVFGAGDVHFPIAGAPHAKGVYIVGLSCAVK